MAKKKAIKLAAASAVAASAFVAAAPAQTDAASNVAVEVSKAVTQMKVAYHTYSDVTANGEFAPIADVYKEYNAAKAAYKNAKALVTKAGGEHKEAYLAQLDATYNEYIAKRVVTYIDAFNYATALEDKKEALEAALEGKEWDKAEELYHEISYELKTRTVILHRVYGQTARNLLVDAFKVEAQDTRDSITNEVSVKMYYDKAADLVDESKLEEAKKAMDHVADYVAKLDKDTDFGAALLTQVSEVKAAYEAKLAPAVESVSAINATQVVVKFNKELDKTTAEAEGNYKFNGTVLSTYDGSATAVLQDDKKSVLVTFSASKNKTSFTFGVDGVKTSEKKDVAAFSTTVAVDDTVNPEVKSVTFASNGDLEINFSEPLTNVNPIVRVAGQPVVITSVVAGDTKVVVPAANHSVAAGATASVYVAGAKDTVGNEMSIFNGSVTKVADSTKPTIASVQQVGQDTLRVVFSETLGGTAADLNDGDLKFLKGAALNSTNSTVVKNTTVDPSGKTYDVTFTDAEVYGSPATDSATVTLLLAKDAVKDVAGNGIEQYSQSFTFSADKTGPKFVSSAVATNKQSIELTFNEAFAADVAGPPAVNNIDENKIIVTDANGVRYQVIDAETVAKGSGEDAKVLLVDFVSSTGTITNGTYTVQLQAGAVKDALGNTSAAATTTVTVGDSADTTKPVASLDASSGVNKYVVNFTEEVTTATALSLGNYKLDGKALPSNAVIYFNSAAKNSVTIELPEGSVNIGNASSGTDALLNVSGVQDKAGNTMDSKNFTVKVGDNTAAVLESAQKLGNTIVLSFNENLGASAADAAIADVLANYEIKAGDTAVVVGSGVATAELVAGSANKVQITFSTTTGTNYDATKTITVKTKSAGDLTDANGYKVKTDVQVTAN